jgi:hypothetical protein
MHTTNPLSNVSFVFGGGKALSAVRVVVVGGSQGPPPPPPSLSLCVFPALFFHSGCDGELFHLGRP